MRLRNFYSIFGTVLIFIQLECNDVARIYFSEHAPQITVLKRCLGSSALVYCRPLAQIEPHQKAYLHLRARYINGHANSSWITIRTKAPPWSTTGNGIGGRTAFVVEQPTDRKADRMDLACDLEIYDAKTNCSIRYENSSSHASVHWFPCAFRQPSEVRLCLWNETVILECLRPDVPLEWSWYRKVPVQLVLQTDENVVYDGPFSVDSNRLIVQILDEGRLGKYVCYGFDAEWKEFYEKEFLLKIAVKPESPVSFVARKTGDTSAWITWTPVEPGFSDSKLERVYSKKSDWYILHYQMVGSSLVHRINTTERQVVIRNLKERTLYRAWLRSGNAAGLSGPIRVMFATGK